MLTCPATQFWGPEVSRGGPNITTLSRLKAPFHHCDSRRERLVQKSLLSTLLRHVARAVTVGSCLHETVSAVRCLGILAHKRDARLQSDTPLARCSSLESRKVATFAPTFLYLSFQTRCRRSCVAGLCLLKGEDQLKAPSKQAHRESPCEGTATNAPSDSPLCSG